MARPGRAVAVAVAAPPRTMRLLLQLRPQLRLRLRLRLMMRRPLHQNWSRRERVRSFREAIGMASQVPRRPLKDRRQCLLPTCRA